jgi:hypothetical protein
MQFGDFTAVQSTCENLLLLEASFDFLQFAKKLTPVLTDVIEN